MATEILMVPKNTYLVHLGHLHKAEENIDFMPTILSRFDTIFIVKDEHNEERDITLARHVMQVHVNAGATTDDAAEGELSLAFLKKYINYARARCGPRLSKEAAEKLKNKYVMMRSGTKEIEDDGVYLTGKGPRDFRAPSWGKIGNIGGQQILPSAQETISVGAGEFDSILLTWKTGGQQSKVWIVDDFPFPILGKTFMHVSQGIPPVEYDFELLDY